ncbi:hypothetical protein [Caldimonas brevitalea]|uniref:Uncharacterized protein n=1 Tax=Caldimonas brevitalea TaxID=413882 RepID=A0A0G3BR97_9BURK|nr:hypothetical protein [Caldimonas brevitalea]AKJ31947.1 hypothetical protein AAW51_5256 [Caldimonas brevitalea]
MTFQRRMTLLSASMAVACLSACSSMMYQPPASAPQATMTVINVNAPAKRVLGVAIYKQDDCRDGGKGVLSSGIGENGRATFKIEASQPLTFIVAGHDRGDYVKNCQAPSTFTPQSDRHYKVSYYEDAGSCRVEIHEERAGGGLTPVPFEAKRFDRATRSCR